MKCSIIQYPIYWENSLKNTNFLEKILTQHTINNQLVILPETFNTGFSMNLENLAEKKNGKTVQWMQEQAKKRKITIIGSLFIKEKEKYYNRLFIVYPDKTIKTYNKKHLFPLTREIKEITPGKNSIVFIYKGFKIKPLICYDIRFPVWSKNKRIDNKNLEYDILLYIANWPQDRIKHWDKLLVARAIENQCFVIGVNRTGKDGLGISHNGHSSVIDPWGNYIAYSIKKEDVLQVNIEKKVLKKNRKNFPFYLSSDTFTLS